MAIERIHLVQSWGILQASTTKQLYKKFLLREVAFDPADVLLLDLPRPDLLLHLPSLLRVPAEQEKTGSESIQTVNGPQVLESVLLGQDEDDGVVTVAAAWVNLKIAGF